MRHPATTAATARAGARAGALFALLVLAAGGRALADGGAAPPPDLLRVGGFVVLDGEAARPRYRAGTGRLYRREDDGSEALVGVAAVGRPVGEAIAGGVKIGGHVRYGVAVERDTLGEVDDADLSRLRCVRLVRPTEEQRPYLARLDLSKVVFVDGGAAGDGVPWLPPGARHVVLGAGLEGRGPADLADLADHADLESLVLGAHDARCDLHPLTRLARLRTLDLSGRDVAHLRALSRSKELRRLDAAGCVAVDDLTPLAACRHLEHLDVSFTAVADLGPLASHPALRTLVAVGTRVARLPEGPLPALRSLRLLGAPVPREDVAAFARAHPACEVVADAAAALRPVLAGADRLRVRSGGTCHRVAVRETTLATIEGPEAIAAFVACLRFASPEFDDADLDCASTTFEVLRGETLVASLALHKGTLVRFDGGGWPGDARLSDDGADALVAFAAAHGVETPRAELSQVRRRVAAEAQRKARWAALLPEDIEERLAAATDEQALRETLAPSTRPGPARLALALAVLGAGTTYESRVPDVAALVLLDADADAFAAAVEASRDDVERTLGFARLLLDVPAARARLPVARLDALLPRVLDLLLADPSPDVVSEGIALAALLRRPVALDRLRRVVAARTAVLADDLRGDPFLRAETLRALEALASADDATSASLAPLSGGWSPSVRATYDRLRSWAARARALLPAGLPELLHMEHAAGGEPGALLAASVPDPEARARLAFALLALEDDPRNAGAVARAAEEVLHDDPATALRVAANAAKAAPDDATVLGAARWLLELGGDATGREPHRDAVLSVGAPRLLEASDEPRRVAIMAALGRAGGKAATTLLYWALERDGPAVAFAAAQALLSIPDVETYRISVVLDRFAPPERAWLEERLAER